MDPFVVGSRNPYGGKGVRLAERLSEASLGGKVFLCNSGTEAAECAIKLARKHARARDEVYPEIVSLDGGFHGRTLGALAATPRLADDDRFGPLPRGFTAIPRDDPDALLHTLASAGIVVRDMRHLPGLADALRITVGTADEMTALDTALRKTHA